MASSASIIKPLLKKKKQIEKDLRRPLAVGLSRAHRKSLQEIKLSYYRAHPQERPATNGTEAGFNCNHAHTEGNFV